MNSGKWANKQTTWSQDIFNRRQTMYSHAVFAIYSTDGIILTPEIYIILYCTLIFIDQIVIIYHLYCHIKFSVTSLHFYCQCHNTVDNVESYGKVSLWCFFKWPYLIEYFFLSNRAFSQTKFKTYRRYYINESYLLTHCYF